MEIQPKQPTAQGPAENFIGDVWFDVIAAGVPPLGCGSAPCGSPRRTRGIVANGQNAASPKAGDSSEPEAGR